MQMRGIVMTADLEERPPGSDNVELVLTLQGVGRGQPRRIVVPMDYLVGHPEIDPDAIAGHAFGAEVVEAEPKRWIVEEIVFDAHRVLRDEGSS